MEQTIKKHAVKIQVATAVSILLFAIVTTWNARSTKADTDERLQYLEIKSEQVTHRLDGLDTKVAQNTDSNRDLDVRLASIDAQLQAVQATLLEIKNKLK